MKNTFYIIQRELYAYFASPLAYVVMAFYLIFSGFIFSAFMRPQGLTPLDATQVLRGYFQNMGFILLFFGSLLSTRQIADEQRTGTLELLFTSPVRSWEVVLGKWLATMFLFIILQLFTTYYVITILIVGGRIDVGATLTGYLGLILEGGVFFAIGLFASAISNSQVIAAVVSLITSLVLWILGPLVVRPENTEWWAEFLRFVSLQQHIESFARGVIDLRDTVYFLSLITFFLFSTAQAIAVRRTA
jgi:ABC-2 type transport system permease protein